LHLALLPSPPAMTRLTAVPHLVLPTGSAICNLAARATRTSSSVGRHGTRYSAVANCVWMRCWQRAAARICQVEEKKDDQFELWRVCMACWPPASPTSLFLLHWRLRAVPFYTTPCHAAHAHTPLPHLTNISPHIPHAFLAMLHLPPCNTTACLTLHCLCLLPAPSLLHASALPHLTHHLPTSCCRLPPATCPPCPFHLPHLHSPASPHWRQTGMGQDDRTWASTPAPPTLPYAPLTCLPHHLPYPPPPHPPPPPTPTSPALMHALGHCTAATFLPIPHTHAPHPHSSGGDVGGIWAVVADGRAARQAGRPRREQPGRRAKLTNSNTRPG